MGCAGQGAVGAGLSPARRYQKRWKSKLAYASQLFGGYAAGNAEARAKAARQADSCATKFGWAGYGEGSLPRAMPLM